MKKPKVTKKINDVKYSGVEIFGPYSAAKLTYKKKNNSLEINVIDNYDGSINSINLDAFETSELYKLLKDQFEK